MSFYPNWLGLFLRNVFFSVKMDEKCFWGNVNTLMLIIYYIYSIIWSLLRLKNYKQSIKS